MAANSPKSPLSRSTLIQVEYEPLPVVGSAEQARNRMLRWSTRIGETSNLLEHIKVRHGDVEQGFAEADVVVEREYRTPTYDHMFIEPECSDRRAGRTTPTTPS